VELIGPYARQVLAEMNQDMLLGTGEIQASGVRPSPDGGREAIAAADLHNLVFQRDFRIVPATIRGA
jgi:hypothetical protein